MTLRDLIKQLDEIKDEDQDNLDLPVVLTNVGLAGDTECVAGVSKGDMDRSAYCNFHGFMPLKRGEYFVIDIT